MTGSTVAFSAAIKTEMQLQNLDLETCTLPVLLLDAIAKSSPQSLRTLRIYNWHDVETDPWNVLPLFPTSVVLNFPHLTHLTIHDRKLDLTNSLRFCKRLQHLDVGQNSPFTIAKLCKDLENLTTSTITSLRLDFAQVSTRGFTFKKMEKILSLPVMSNLKKLYVDLDWGGVIHAMDSSQWVASWKIRGVEIILVERTSSRVFVLCRFSLVAVHRGASGGMDVTDLL